MNLRAFLSGLMLGLLVASAVLLSRFTPELRTVTIPAPMPQIEQPLLTIELPKMQLVAPIWPPISGDTVSLGWRYRRQVEQAALRYLGSDLHAARLAAQIHQESAWMPDARSHAGARGMSQFMPRTAIGIAKLRPELRPADVTNPDWAIKAQAALLADIGTRWGAPDPCNNWAIILSAYNGGERMLAAEQAKANEKAAWFGANGIEPQQVRRQSAWIENRDYVRQILLRLEPMYIRAGWRGTQACVVAS